MNKVFMEMVHEFDRPVFHRAADGHIVRHCQVLNQLAQADATGVRVHRYPKLGSHQEDGEVLVDATHSGGVDLDQVHSPRLEELFEHHAVVSVLPCGNGHRTHRPADRCMTQHIIRTRGLLHPCNTDLREWPEPLDRFRNTPALIRVNRTSDIRTDSTTCNLTSPQIVRRIQADFELDRAKPVSYGPDGKLL